MVPPCRPPDAGQTGAQVPEELLSIACAHFGIGRADARERVRIAAADGNCRASRSRPVGDDLLDQRVVRFEHRAVAHLEGGEQREQRAQVILERHLPPQEKEEMVEREEHALLAQVAAVAFEDASSQRLDLSMNPLVDPVRRRYEP